MSPEQATGDQTVGPATDIWALGCVLYEMLVGQPPYTGSTPQAVLGKIIVGQPDLVTKHRRTVPANVDAAIRRALEKVPADRFTGAQAFAAALADGGFRHGQLKGFGIGADRRGAWRAAAAAAVLSAAVAGFVVWHLKPEAARESQPISRFEIQPPGGHVLAVFVAQPLALTTDGRFVVMNASPAGTAERPDQLFMRPLEGLEWVPIRGTESAGSFVLSPDGEWVGFWDGINLGTLRKVPLAGGVPTTIAETEPAGFGGAAWGEQGAIVFATGAYPGLMRVSDVGGRPEPLTAPDEGSAEVHAFPHFLPGGEHLLFQISQPGEPDEIAVLSVATGDYAVLTTGSFPQYVAEGYVIFMRATALWALAFDPDRPRVDAEPVPVLEGVEDPFRRTVGGVRPFSISPAGTLAFDPLSEVGEAPRMLVWVDRSGVEQPLPVEPRPYLYPRISPQGDRLAVAIADDVLDMSAGNPADLWVFDLDRFVRSRITFGGNNRWFPVWTPAGDRLVFSDGAVGWSAIRLAAADGSGQTTTLLEGEGSRFPSSWSSDGRVLAFYQYEPGDRDRDLWVLPAGGQPEPFMVAPFTDRAPMFSPDGRWIAYVSDKSGRDEVYVRPYPGPGPEVTASLAGGREPVWSREGSELFYRSEDQLMAMAVRPGDAFQAETPRALFSDRYEKDPSIGGIGGTPNYDVAPDGQRFVMIRRDESDQRKPLIVVLNWSEELKRLVPN
jgi:serine/threonine-protein kinase